MLWTLLPFCAAFFYALGSSIQNYLVDLALPRGRAGVFILARLPVFILSAICLPLLFGRSVFVLPLTTALGFILAGAVNVFASMQYFKALQLGDTMDVTIFNQATPLFSLGLGVAFLDEVITVNQALGFLFIFAAIALILITTSNKKSRHTPNLRVAGLTLFYGFFSVLSDIIYVYFFGNHTADFVLFAQSFCFFQIGSGVFALLALIFIPSWRKVFRQTFLAPKKHHFLLAALLDCLCFIVAEVLFKLGLILAPVVALLTVISKAVGIFASFILNLAFGKVFPKFFHSRRITKRLLFVYALASVLVVMGVFTMS